MMPPAKVGLNRQTAIIVGAVTLCTVGIVRAVISGGMTVPPPEPKPAHASPPSEVARPPIRNRAVLHRPAPADAAPKRKPKPEPEHSPVVILQRGERGDVHPWALDDLPEGDRARLGAQALEGLGQLHEACGSSLGEEYALVLLNMRVDERGLAEVEIASYDGAHAVVAEDVPLPDALVACLDDAIWGLEWPNWEPGLTYALTGEFGPED